MADIFITKKSESEILLITNNVIILDNIRRRFSVKIPNVFYMPRYKKTHWDGKVYFIKGNIAPYGLLFEILKYCKLNNYTYELNFEFKNNIDEDKIQTFIKSQNLPYDLHPYQFKSITDVLKYGKLNIELPTGSGKTLIAYLLVKYFLNKKILIIVPRINLLEQMYGDFKNYGFSDIEKYVFCKYTGEEFSKDKNIYISTWQSVYKLDKEFFKQFDVLIVDEAHSLKGNELFKISKETSNAKFKIGLSGTFGKYKEYDWYQEVAAIGPIVNYINYKQLQELKQIPDFKVKVLILNYPKEIIDKFYEYVGKDFRKEQDFINSCNLRNNFLLKMSQDLSKNSIFLFTFKEKHGKILYDLMKDNQSKKVFYIDGDTSAEDRELIRDVLENNDNVMGLASFGIFAEGVSVKNLHNIILASNYKSRIKILQSIGRGLRMHENKNIVKIFDVVDNFKSDIYSNYSLKHLKERIKVYKEKQIPYEIVEINL